MYREKQREAFYNMEKDAQEQGRDLAFTMVFPFNVTEQDVIDFETMGIEIFKPFYKSVYAISIPKYFAAGIVVTI